MLEQVRRDQLTTGSAGRNPRGDNKCPPWGKPGGPMGYRMTVKHRDGTVERTRHWDGRAALLVSNSDRACGVVVKDHTMRKVGYNFSEKIYGRKMSKYQREELIRRQLEAERNDPGKGWSRGRTMKKIGSIPPEIWYSELAEGGPEALRDPKDKIRLMDKWGLRTSK
uniref:Uncharacterized protein n=2 Tax=viral metagenome TaxID=1070528 RepID=A0A6H1ZF59_9ZZZZ